MRAVVQRVISAQVSVEAKTVGKIARGFLVYLGIGRGDNAASAEWMLQKLCKIRLFADESGKLQHSIREVQGSILLVSQFTLYASIANGLRPSFAQAMPPADAAVLFEHFCNRARNEIPLQTGQFGADMQVSSINDGPITLLLDSETPDA
jgi:D-aminoacyl-tRNA deacylase